MKSKTIPFPHSKSPRLLLPARRPLLSLSDLPLALRKFLAQRAAQPTLRRHSSHPAASLRCKLRAEAQPVAVKEKN